MYTNYLDKVSVIDENFLSHDECGDIKNKILSVKHLWQNSGPELQPFNFLPFGLYSVDFKIYKDSVVKYRPMMSDLFGSYYEKVRLKVAEIVGIETVYQDTLNYPGFHISTGLPFPINFHIDKFPSLHYFFNSDRRFHCNTVKILSIILPISLPSDGAGLLFKKSMSDDLYDELPYKEGMLATWGGSVVHSIKPFGPRDPNDFRITMQLHAAIVEPRAYIFW